VTEIGTPNTSRKHPTKRRGRSWAGGGGGGSLQMSAPKKATINTKTPTQYCRLAGTANQRVNSNKKPQESKKNKRMEFLNRCF
jgi:hypothetical protein